MIKIAINGFGRIGRPVFRRIFENHPNCQELAINDLADPKTLAHLLKYDSVYRNYPESVNYTENSLVVGRGTNKKIIKIFAEKNPEKLPWKKLGIDVVL